MIETRAIPVFTPATSERVLVLGNDPRRRRVLFRDQQGTLGVLAFDPSPQAPGIAFDADTTIDLRYSGPVWMQNDGGVAEWTTLIVEREMD